MWYMTDPEELKNYQCNISLKKAKENLIRRYSYLNGDNLRHEPEHSLSRRLSPVLRDNLRYTGISSNPLLSLTAHGADLNQSNQFACWVIPVKYARELKAEALALDQFQHVTDGGSDYIAAEQPHTYLYNFLAEEGRILSIDTTGFTPLKYIPSRPAQIFAWRPDGSRFSQTIETKDRDSYPEILQSLLTRAQAGEFTSLLLRCQGATIMQCDIREGGYDLYFDARTSQSGYVHRYLPEEGREGDWEALCGLLLHFLRFYKKPRGTKWKYVRKVLASDNMRFVNGMICPD